MFQSLIACYNWGSKQIAPLFLHSYNFNTQYHKTEKRASKVFGLSLVIQMN